VGTGHSCYLNGIALMKYNAVMYDMMQQLWALTSYTLFVAVGKFATLAVLSLESDHACIVLFEICKQ